MMVLDMGVVGWMVLAFFTISSTVSMVLAVRGLREHGMNYLSALPFFASIFFFGILVVMTHPLEASDSYKKLVKYTPQVAPDSGLTVVDEVRTNLTARLNEAKAEPTARLVFTWRGEVSSAEALAEMTAFLNANEEYKSKRITTASVNPHYYLRDQGSTVLVVEYWK